MLYLTIIVSISSTVLANCLSNSVCKKELKTNSQIFKFNIISYMVCIALLAIGMIGGQISLFTLVLGLIFGVVTALSKLYSMLALTKGPMHITLLITTSSMIIPTMSGIFFGEKFNLFKFIFVVILIGFIYLTLNTSKGGEMNKKWFIFCMLAFVCQGCIGVLQKIHQNSQHKGETTGFLLIAFMCSLIYSWIMSRKDGARVKFKTKHIVIAVIYGICVYVMNVLNLKLSGIIPSQLFFPLVNGSTIVLSSTLSVVLFKEHISKKQTIGLIGGILSLIAICLVP